MNEQYFYHNSLESSGARPSGVNAFPVPNSTTLLSESRTPGCMEENTRLPSDAVGRNMRIPSSSLCSSQYLNQAPYSGGLDENFPTGALPHSDVPGVPSVRGGFTSPIGIFGPTPCGVRPTGGEGSSLNGVITSTPMGQPPSSIQDPLSTYMMTQTTPFSFPLGAENDRNGMESEYAPHGASTSYPFPIGGLAYPSQSNSSQNMQGLQQQSSTFPQSQLHHDPVYGGGAHSFSTTLRTEGNSINGNNVNDSRNSLCSQMPLTALPQHFPSANSANLSSQTSSAVPSSEPYGQQQKMKFSTFSSPLPTLSNPPFPLPSQIAPVVSSGAFSHETLSAAISANAYQNSQEINRRKQEEEDKAQLEKIIRLRRELELEEERDKEKEREKETWGCDTCTFRNPLSCRTCGMCHSSKPGFSGLSQSVSTTVETTSSFRQTDSNAIWDCHQCFTRNNGGETHCIVCRVPRGTVGQSQGKTNEFQTGVTSSKTASQPSSPFNSYWRCCVCSEVNSPRRSNCKICNGYRRNGTPVDKPLTTLLSGSRAAVQTTTNTTGSTETVPTVWNCSVCTLENSVQNSVCSACESGQRPRHLAPPEKKREKELSSKGLHKAFSSTHDGNATSSTSPSSVYPRALLPASTSNWECPECTFLNSSSRTRCDMCGTKNPIGPQVGEGKKREEDSDDEEENNIMWQEDHTAKECNNCGSEFGLLTRRHHCRACGYVFCARCTPFYMSLKKDKPPVRVCITCYVRDGKK